MRRRTFDPKCYDLAVHFLADHPEKDTPNVRDYLASEIQQAIEDCLILAVDDSTQTKASAP